MIYFILLISAILIIFGVLGFMTSKRIAHKKQWNEPKLSEYKNDKLPIEYLKKIKDWIAICDFFYLEILSPYHYKLNVMNIKGSNSDKYVILLHGVGVSHKYMLGIAYMYNQMGYGVLALDSRHHGKSGGKNISYGYYEKNDLMPVVEYARNKTGKNGTVGLHGISMGAGILLAYASQVRDDCDFYIADCPYSDFYLQAKAVAKRLLKFPDFMMSLIMVFTNFFQRYVYKFDLRKVDILSKMYRIEGPVLFFSCRDDNYISPKMTADLFEASDGMNKKIVWFNEGGHAGAFSKHPYEYKREILGFLNTYVDK